MNRRGHMSHKIPNVKLRPAPAASAARPAGGRGASPENFMNQEIQRQAWADADHDESPAAFNKVSRPLEGICLTLTGVENKLGLTNIAKDMGAEVDPNLTIHVTHLVAEQAGSQKYNYAVMHRLPVLAPSWLLACHHEWISGNEIDAKAMAQDHGLLPFIGCTIAVSGIEPASRRQEAMQLIYNLGGIYSKSLDRNCTHLVTVCSATDPNASAKVKWALDQNENRRLKGENEGDIAVVYEEWIWDCVHFNGRWPEAEYDIRGDRPESRVAREQAKLEAIKEAADLPADLPDEKEPVVLRKRPAGGFDNLVGELISTTTATATAPAPSLAAESSKTARERSLSPRQLAKRPSSVLHTSRSTSFAISKYPQIFKGLRIGFVVLEREAGPLQTALESHGAQVVPREEWELYEALDYLVVRLASGQRPQSNARQIVTECWVEACVYEEKLLAVDERLVYRPLSTTIPVPAFLNTRIHMTAIRDDHTEHCARRLIGALGGSLSQELTRETTHILSDLRTGRKVDRAAAWGIPVLPLAWLYKCATEGELVDMEEYRYAVPPTKPKRTLSTSSSNLTVPSNLSVMSDLAPLDFGAVNRKILPALPASAPPSQQPPLEKKNSMTDVLRQFAEQQQLQNAASNGWKSTRRTRPASRLKGLSHSPLTSPRATQALSPTPATQPLEPPSPSQTQPPPDESLRVAYVDPVADKEKRRLMDALRKGAGEPQSTVAPAKRRRRLI